MKNLPKHPPSIKSKQHSIIEVLEFCKPVETVNGLEEISALCLKRAKKQRNTGRL